jgi:hypothetical protein
MSRVLVALALLILAIAVVVAALIISGSDIEVPVLSDLIATSTPESGADGSEANPDSTATVVVEPISTSTPATEIPATAVTQPTQTSTPDSTAAPQQSESVAFTSEPVQITNIATGAFDPSWNPTGENIAFLQWKAENRRLCRVARNNQPASHERTKRVPRIHDDRRVASTDNKDSVRWQ